MRIYNEAHELSWHEYGSDRLKEKRNEEGTWETKTEYCHTQLLLHCIGLKNVHKIGKRIHICNFPPIVRTDSVDVHQVLANPICNHQIHGHLQKDREGVEDNKTSLPGTHASECCSIRHLRTADTQHLHHACDHCRHQKERQTHRFSTCGQHAVQLDMVIDVLKEAEEADHQDHKEEHACDPKALGFHGALWGQIMPKNRAWLEVWCRHLQSFALELQGFLRPSG
mmetsp:Transcript_39978/g.71966  ORF Transcript_39978/g.71966 Transcript_39978/m.71966 type:complete len:225 (-) Transcript_39978:1578-2252(-)